MQAAEKLLWLALEVSGYQNASVAAMLAIGASLIGVWVWGKPWLQRKIQKSCGRKKWTYTWSNVSASALTLLILAIPTFYKGSTRAQVDIQEFFIIDHGPVIKSLVLLANVHNLGESPIVPEKFQISVLNESNVFGPFDSLPFPGKQFEIYPSDFPGDKTFSINHDEFLENRLTEKPVAMGVPINGWLVFDFLGVRDWRNAQYFLEFRDSFGKKEKLELPVPVKIPPRPEEIRFHRGVRYPFREKSELTKPERSIFLDGSMKTNN